MDASILTKYKEKFYKKIKFSFKLPPPCCLAEGLKLCILAVIYDNVVFISGCSKIYMGIVAIYCVLGIVG